MLAPRTVASLQACFETQGCAAGSSMQVVANSTSTGRWVLDSRQVQPGDVFVAVKGARDDGHRWVGQAVAAGAACVIGTQAQHALDVPYLHVTDALVAAQAMARSVRAGAPEVPLIGVTGSYGKTTTKTLLAALLRAAGRHPLVTEGNFNNHWGVPLTVSRWSSKHDAVVLEMGANHQGELRALAALVEPHVGTITAVGPCHLEGFGGLEGVVRGKGELVADVAKRQGWAVIPADVSCTASLLERCDGCDQVVTFGRTAAAGVRASQVRLNDAGEPVFTLHVPNGEVTEVHVPMLGEHQVHNALAAVASLWAMAHQAGWNLPWTEVLQGAWHELEGVQGRLQRYPTPEGAWVLDDSYNASPDAFEAALATLLRWPGPHVVVMGGMGELGSEAEIAHRRLGERMKALGVDALVTYGPFSAYAYEAFAGPGGHATSHSACLDRLKPFLAEGTQVLVKGSRSNHLEHVVNALRFGHPVPTNDEV